MALFRFKFYQQNISKSVNNKYHPAVAAEFSAKPLVSWIVQSVFGATYNRSLIGNSTDRLESKISRCVPSCHHPKSENRKMFACVLYWNANHPCITNKKHWWSAIINWKFLRWVAREENPVNKVAPVARCFGAVCLVAGAPQPPLQTTKKATRRQSMTTLSTTPPRTKLWPIVLPRYTNISTSNYSSNRSNNNHLTAPPQTKTTTVATLAIN